MSTEMGKSTYTVLFWNGAIPDQSELQLPVTESTWELRRNVSIKDWGKKEDEKTFWENMEDTTN